MSRVLLVSRDSIPKANPAGLVAYRYASLFSRYREVKLISIISSNGCELSGEYINDTITIKKFFLKKNKLINMFIYIAVFFYILRDFIFYNYRTLVTHTNPLYSHFYGFLLKILTLGQVRWVASFTDPYSNSPFEKGRFISAGSIVRKIEESIVFNMSDHMVFVTETMCDYILRNDQCLKKKSLVIPFFFLDGLKNKLINIKYQGSNKKEQGIEYIHPGAIYGNRSASELFKAFSFLKNVNLNVYGKVNNINTSEVGTNIKIHPPIDYNKLVIEIGKCDFVIIIDSFFDNIKNPYMPSKVIDAMYLDKPIIGITDLGTELDIFLKRTNNYSVANDAMDICDVINNIRTPIVDYSFYSESYIYENLKNNIKDLLR